MDSAFTRRALLRAAGAATLAGCASPIPLPRASTPHLRLLGETTLPHKMQFQGTTVGGLSGIDFDPATGTWVAISDDRSELQPARFYALDIGVTPQGIAVQVKGVSTLRGPDGRPYPPRGAPETIDPESIRLLPQGRGVLWTSEGDPRANRSPAVTEARLDGSYVREFDLPAMLRWPAKPGTGPRNNLTFEGLALTPDARTAWVAMEAALEQDGPVPRVGAAGGPCRFTAFDVASGQAVRQVAYIPDPIPRAPQLPGGFADNGVSEILMLDADRMLVLERSFAMGTGMSLRIYAVDTREGSDVLRQDKLVAGEFRALTKQPVADFADFGLSRLDNTEGMCWGPRLPNGRRTLVVVSDDNFAANQVTQFAAFEFLD
ncbi:esterase-like activity of phytase family protein [Ramlibacter sp. XY19]|uniref:esterase-like activity of phytase family protein n=1 Tax=Ramlibacter paludis TaxID=2908000 RepID=UPI0023D9D33C|nr:esterase-like activity of phytase family protein [Ramlibacter paludis]MCG2594853.1 esterase-like activity of phytase family protein [Ramlibacter paludis]